MKDDDGDEDVVFAVLKSISGVHLSEQSSIQPPPSPVYK